MMSNKFGLNLKTVFSYKPFFDEKLKNKLQKQYTLWSQGSLLSKNAIK